MFTDLDLESQILGFRVRRMEKKKGRRNWKESKRRTNCSQRNLFLHRNGWYGKYCSTRKQEKTRPFLASLANSNQTFAFSAKLLGGLFDEEEEASRAYDPAALKICSESTPLNFPVSDYENEVEDMKAFSKKGCMLHIRRNMARFAKGMSKLNVVEFQSKFLSAGNNRAREYLITLCAVDISFNQI